MILSYIKRNLRMIRVKKAWREKNSKNYTRVNSIFDHSLVEVGDYTYGTINVSSTNSLSKVYIGRFCSIADNVLFMVNNDHPLHYFSTYPFMSKLFGGKSEAISKGNIVVEDDVWIGNNVTIMSGVTIGQGAVIGTGAVVTKDVKPYSIVGGVPAKVIKMRFSQQIIDELLKVDFSQIDIDFIKKNQSLLYSEIDGTSPLTWLPIKDTVI